MAMNLTAWPPGWPRSLDYPRLPVYQILEQSAQRIPRRTAIIFPGQSLSYAELKELSDRLAAALLSLGVQKGERVALQLPNSPQFALAYYGLLKAGAVFCPLSPLLTPQEAAYQLQDSGARTLITLEGLYPELAGKGVALELPRRIVVNLADSLSPPAPPAQASPAGTRAFNQLLREHDPLPAPVEVDPARDLAHLAYTGGTTGRSKGVMLDHCNVLANVMQGSLWCLGARVETKAGRMEVCYPGGADTARERIFQRDREVALLVAPWFHAMGVVALNNQLFLGSTVVIFPRFDPQRLLAAAREHRATFINGAPPVYRQIFNHPSFQGHELKTIKWAVSGAAPLPPSLLERMLAHIPGVITEGYGLSECTAAATANPPDRQAMRPGSIGLPLFDTEIKVVDPASGKRLPPGREGELCIRGPQVMRGYWNNPQATSQVLKQGWLHTGDIGRQDQEGYFYITDRLKDLILYKGYNVYPRELEEVLMQHPQVELAAVLGLPDAESGERVVAFVQPKSGESPHAAELMEFVNRQVAPYKKLRELHLVERIPVSGPGKVLKRVLRRQFAGPAAGPGR